MNPFGDVTYFTVQAWSELDARMEERSCASGSSVEELDNWHSIEPEDYYRQLMHEGCPRPLGERIGILRRAWIDLSNAPAIDSRGTVKRKFLPGVTEVMENWVQMSHDGSRYRISTEAYARRIEGQVRVFRTFPECRAGEGGTPLDEARALARPMYCPPAGRRSASVVRQSFRRPWYSVADASPHRASNRSACLRQMAGGG